MRLYELKCALFIHCKKKIVLKESEFEENNAHKLGIFPSKTAIFSVKTR
jgi:hypothetical protein